MMEVLASRELVGYGSPLLWCAGAGYDLWRVLSNDGVTNSRNEEGYGVVRYSERVHQ